MHQYLHTFDNRLGSYILSFPQWLHPFMATITALGHPTVIFSLMGGLIIAGIIKQSPKIWLAGSGVLAVVGINALLKLAFQRLRPDTDYVRAMIFDSYSFPSGHSCGSMVAFGLLAYLAFQHLPAPWGGIILGIFACLIFLIGVSRVYLGAHYPSDVLAGWIVGALGLGLIIFIMRLTE